MTPDEIQAQILKMLKNIDGLSAPNIAKVLKVTKTEVNSVLYRGKGSLFESEGDRPPIWSLRNKNDKTVAVKKDLLTRNIKGKIHVDFAGGDWEVEIGVIDMSRNDPIARVERLGSKKRLIAISNQVVSKEEQEKFYSDNKIPDAALSMAAAVLAWEIFVELHSSDPEKFNFEKAVSDIFLSMSANSKVDT